MEWNGMSSFKRFVFLFLGTSCSPFGPLFYWPIDTFLMDLGALYVVEELVYFLTPKMLKAWYVSQSLGELDIYLQTFTQKIMSSLQIYCNNKNSVNNTVLLFIRCTSFEHLTSKFFIIFICFLSSLPLFLLSPTYT